MNIRISKFGTKNYSRNNFLIPYVQKNQALKHLLTTKKTQRLNLVV